MAALVHLLSLGIQGLVLGFRDSVLLFASQVYGGIEKKYIAVLLPITLGSKNFGIMFLGCVCTCTRVNK